MRSAVGFTLLEVIFAGVILAVGVTAMATFQLQALAVQQRLRTVRQLVGVAEDELQRALLRFPGPGTADCPGVSLDTSHSIESCLVSVASCSDVGASCTGTNSSRVRRVEVTVEGADGATFTLSGLTARFPP